MNIFKRIWNRFNNALGGGTKATSHVTGIHNAMSWSDAEFEMVVQPRNRVSRFKEKPNGWFLEWDDKDQIFVEGIKGSEKRKLYAPKDHPADMIACDWYVV